MKKIAYAVLSLMMLCGTAAAQPNAAADEAAVRALEDKWDAASVKGDAAALDSIWADKFISTSSEGKVRGKAEMLAEVKSGDIKYQTAKVDDMKVYVYGDTAVVNGRWHGKFVQKGKTVDTTER